MTFQSPGGLFALVIVPIVIAYYVSSRKKMRRRSDALASEGLVATGTASDHRARRHVPFALFVGALALLAIAFARPIATIKTFQRQATVIVALDVSNSMAATDAKPSRFAVAKRAATAFIRQQPDAVRIGVVAFGQSAVIVQRPSTAHATAIAAIDHLSLGGGTSIASGILTSLDAIAGKTLTINTTKLAEDNSGDVDIGYFGGSTIVLFSDGENTSQTDPTTFARVASTAGVRIQTVGVGSPAGTTVKIGGFSIATALNAQTMKSVAAVSNGSYHQVTDQAGLAALAKTIDLHFALVSRRTEISAAFTAAAAVLLIVGALLSVLWFGRVI